MTSLEFERTRFTTTLARCAVVALLVMAPAGAWAQSGVDADLRVGVYTDVSETFVGGGFLTPLGASGWYFNPNLEWVLLDRGDLFTVNADFHNDLPMNGDLHGWLGAGLALVDRENRFGNGSSDVGLNLLGGVGFLRGRPVRPYLQAKILLSDDTEGVVAVGIRFF
jgi:hypothetical protein